jgi:DNA-binding MarR family transcriptional regulator
MGKTKISQVTPLDAWLIRRLIAGYTPNPHHLKQATPVVMHLLGFLGEINPEYRDQTVQMNLLQPAYDRVQQVDPESSAPGEERQWIIVHADELEKLPPLTWLIDKEIPESGLTVLFGESGAGKSFIGLDYALRIAQQHPVVYIPTEGQAGYYKRVWAWCQHHKLGRGKLHFLFGAMSLLDRDMLAMLLDDLLPIQPKLVLVDTLAMAMAGGDENSTRDMSLVIKACRSITFNIKSAVVLVHHVGKTGASERGSTALRGNADTMIRVSPADDLVLVECSKTKDEKPFDPRYIKLLPVSVEGVGDSLVPIPSQHVIRQKGDPLTANQKKLLEFLMLEVNEEGTSIRDIGDSISMSVGMVQRVLSNLLYLKYVHKPFGSYVITDEGKQVLKQSIPEVNRLNRTESEVNRQVNRFLADESTESAESTHSDTNNNIHINSDSSDSPDSSLRIPIQDRFTIDSVDSPAKRILNGRHVDDDDDEPTQEALLPEHQPRANQYLYEQKRGGKR